MDFELSTDQRELAEGIRKLALGRLPLDTLRRAEGAADVVDRAAWAELGQAGVFGLRVPAERGGLGLGAAEAVVVLEELGRALVPGPLVASSLAAVFVDGAADGDVVVGSAARPASGADALVEHLGSLDRLVVVDDHQLALLEPADLAGAPAQRSLDPLSPVWRVADLPVGRVIGDADAAAGWRYGEALLTGALCVGLAAATLDLAVEHAKQRRQFGRPIGSFQAVKHICADMLVRAEVARAAVHAAAVTSDQPEVGDPERAIAGAALLAADAAVDNAKACIQVLGGIGFTWEVPAHLYLMRARVHAATIASTGDLAGVVAARW